MSSMLSVHFCAGQRIFRLYNAWKLAIDSPSALRSVFEDLKAFITSKIDHEFMVFSGGILFGIWEKKSCTSLSFTVNKSISFD